MKIFHLFKWSGVHEHEHILKKKKTKLISL